MPKITPVCEKQNNVTVTAEIKEEDYKLNEKLFIIFTVRRNNSEKETCFGN